METINNPLKCAGLLFLMILPSLAAADSSGGYIGNIAPMRERVQQMEAFWKQKKAEVLPLIMREQGVDFWIVRNDEAGRYYNNEGPVYTSLLPANYEGMTFPSQHVPPGSQATPRIMVFFDDGNDIEYHEPRDLRELEELMEKLNPERIAISYDNSVRLLDALTAYRGSLVDSWTLGVRWLETMVPAQIDAYRSVQGIANELIAEGFSNAAITPGVTTTDDLNWWFRQRMLELDIEYENHPSIRLQRRPEYIKKYAGEAHEFEHGAVGNGQNVVIRPGDVITIDSDIFMLGLVTDSHQHVYILDDGETEVPASLQTALEIVNALQDEYAKEFIIGRTGKEIVAATDEIERPNRVVESEMAFHPPPMYFRRYLLGGYMFSHKTYVAGMTSGPGYYPSSIVSNDHQLHENTLYAYEPHTWVQVDGWGPQGIELGMGQIVVADADGLHYLNRSQQKDWHVVR